MARAAPAATACAGFQGSRRVRWWPRWPSWAPVLPWCSWRAICSSFRRKTMLLLSSLLAGLVFGLGLIVSGMANPAKVLGFLDLAGPWDPSLAFVMAGAIAVGLVAFHVARNRTDSLLGAK